MFLVPFPPSPTRPGSGGPADLKRVLAADVVGRLHRGNPEAQEGDAAQDALLLLIWQGTGTRGSVGTCSEQPWAGSQPPGHQNPQTLAACLLLVRAPRTTLHATKPGLAGGSLGAR